MSDRTNIAQILSSKRYESMLLKTGMLYPMSMCFMTMVYQVEARVKEETSTE